MTGLAIPGRSRCAGALPASESRTPAEALLERPHRVTITKPFYMGKYELTQAQYEAITGANPSVTKGPSMPAHNLSWQNANDFCQKMSAKVSRTVALPTDAEWEYACRAGPPSIPNSESGVPRDR